VILEAGTTVLSCSAGISKKKGRPHDLEQNSSCPSANCLHRQTKVEVILGRVACDLFRASGRFVGTDDGEAFSKMRADVAIMGCRVESLWKALDEFSPRMLMRQRAMLKSRAKKLFCASTTQSSGLQSVFRRLCGTGTGGHDVDGSHAPMELVAGLRARRVGSGIARGSDENAR